MAQAKVPVRYAEDAMLQPGHGPRNLKCPSTISRKRCMGNFIVSCDIGAPTVVKTASFEERVGLSAGLVVNVSGGGQACVSPCVVAVHPLKTHEQMVQAANIIERGKCELIDHRIQRGDLPRQVTHTFLRSAGP
eukprot:5299897-Pleurochrysis_carterae.AAC.1